MQVKILMLDVGDADAIIVQLSRDTGEQLVILVDAGKVSDGSYCQEKLQYVLDKAGKKAPDLIVCTHYDSDHIGGLLRMIARYGQHTFQIWIHQPGILKLTAETATIRLLMERMDRVRRPLKKFQDFKKNPYENVQRSVLESYTQLKKMHELLQPFKDKVVAPFTGVSFPGWPEIKVLGPTVTFYQEWNAKNKDVAALIEEETRLLRESRGSKFMLRRPNEMDNPCKSLADRPKDPVSPVNQISVILRIDAGNEPYLFTGDASLQSFAALPDYPDCIQNMYWLKVPHHGSHNNNSPELFSLINPRFADISGGKRYLDDDVLGCLKQREITVRTTRDSGDLNFPY